MVFSKFWSSSIYHLFHHFLIPITFIFLLGIPHVTPLNFNFQSFNSENTKNIRFEGNASLSSNTSAIELTINPLFNTNSSYGRATYKDQLRLWDKNSRNVTDFLTYFSFTIDSKGSSKFADGMTFYLAPPNFSFPDELQGSGLALLSRNETLSSDKQFVAVEFDTYSNEWDPPDGLPHVGVDINNLQSVRTIPWNSSIPDGRKNEAWIRYTSSAKNLSVIVTGFVGNTTINQTLYYDNIQLHELLPEWVTIGFSAATGLQFETHTLTSWNFTSWTVERPPEKSRTGLIVGLSIGTIIIVFIVALGGIWWWMKRSSQEAEEDIALDQEMEDEFERGFGPQRYTHKQLAKATNKFSEDEKLGEGGSGGVYKGYLKDTNTFIAVKRITKGYRQGLKEFATEVKIISRLRHRNLVQLIGWCHEKDALLLVYEYMSNGSLDSHLFKPETPLTWELRLQIVQGLASSLLYLHEEWEQCVVHRDIKSSNVMLDSNFNAKLGDFGLARLVDHEKGSRTTVLAGTMGYMAPEYATTGKASKESDVYSFGVVVLEIACGRKPINLQLEECQVVLLEWVWELYGSGRLLEAADPRLCGEFDREQMTRMITVGIWCAHPDYNLRPSIRQAIHCLNVEGPLPALPLKMPVATYFSLMAGMPTPPHSSTYGLNSTTSSSQNEQILSLSQGTSQVNTFSSPSTPTSDVLRRTF